MVSNIKPLRGEPGKLQIQRMHGGAFGCPNSGALHNQESMNINELDGLYRLIVFKA